MAEKDMAQKIKELRLAHGMTLEQVSAIVGVGKSTVRKWETGMIANMRRDKIAALAKALHTTPEYLMGWGKPEESEKPTAYDRSGLSDSAKELLDIIQNCTEEQAALLLRLVKSFLAIDG